MNYIVRTAWTRPEMLLLSIESEIEARNHYVNGDYKTLFCVEHGAAPETDAIIRNYPYEYEAHHRSKGFSRPGINHNLLAGMVYAAQHSDDYIIVILDDILIHKTYFQYIEAVMNMDVGKYSSILAHNAFDQGDVHEIFRGNYYRDLAVLITKEFVLNYVAPMVEPFCKDPIRLLTALNKKYVEFYGTKYIYNNLAHRAQDGLMRRLTNAALIEEDRATITPMLDRQVHIGFYGVYRPGKGVPGRNFEERLSNMRKIIEEHRYFEFAQCKEYNDYRKFSPELDEWDGKLILRETNDNDLCRFTK